MKIADAITYCIHYHKINSRPNTLANYEFILEKLGQSYQDWHIDAITTEEIIAFHYLFLERYNVVFQRVHAF